MLCLDKFYYKAWETINGNLDSLNGFNFVRYLSQIRFVKNEFQYVLWHQDAAFIPLLKKKSTKKN